MEGSLILTERRVYDHWMGNDLRRNHHDPVHIPVVQSLLDL